MSFGDMVPDLVEQRAQLSPDKTAFRDLASGLAVTFRKFAERTQKTAGLLLQHDVLEDERIGVLCRNRVEFFEVLFAAAKLKATVVPFNWRMPATELAPSFSTVAPRVLLTGNQDLSAAQTLCDDTHTILLNLDEGFDDQRDKASPFVGSGAWHTNHCWYLLFTSGTTGQPKAVIQTVGMALANHVNIGQAMGIRSDDVTLNYLPLFHTAGINLVTLPTFFQGGTTLISDGFHLETFLDLLQTGDIDTFFAVPTVYQELALHEKFKTLDLGGIRSFGCGGAPMPDVLVKTYLDQGAQVCNGMGMTETGPTVFLMDPEHVADKIGSVGKPQLLAQTRIVDTPGTPVDQGKSGEIQFRGPGVTPGYWKDPENTQKAFTEDGWLRSGDIGQQDQDGYYYIVGRIKDMFISGGENVFPAEIESILAQHESVLEAAVVGIPDDKWGEVGQAYILLRESESQPTTDALKDYCRQHMAAYKIPKAFIFVSDFPRTAAGKIQKHLLPNE